MQRSIIGIVSILSFLVACSKKLTSDKLNAHCSQNTLVSEPIGAVDGKAVLLKDLSPAANFRLAKAQYEQNVAQQNLVKNLLVEKFFLGDSLSKISVSKDDVDQFIKANKGSFPDKVLDEKMLKSIATHLLNAKREEAKAFALRDAKDKLKVHAQLTACPIPLSWPEDVKGLEFPDNKNDGRASITFFGSADCPECRQIFVHLQKLKQQQPDRFNLKIIDLIINESDTESAYPRLAYCVADLAADKLPNYLFYAYEQPIQTLSSAEQSDLYIDQELAPKLAIKADSLKACMKSSAAKNYVESIKSLHQNLGIPRRPMLIMDGNLLILGADELVDKLPLLDYKVRPETT